jgi:K+/H+ antiporter YhaU regulatory subunit KhtT
VIGGAYERPQIVEDLEMALGELLIEWIAVPDDSPSPSLGAEPTDTIERGDTLVTVGKAGRTRSSGGLSGASQ